MNQQDALFSINVFQ